MPSLDLGVFLCGRRSTPEEGNLLGKKKYGGSKVSIAGSIIDSTLENALQNPKTKKRKKNKTTLPQPQTTPPKRPIAKSAGVFGGRHLEGKQARVQKCPPDGYLRVRENLLSEKKIPPCKRSAWGRKGFLRKKQKRFSPGA